MKFGLTAKHFEELQTYLIDPLLKCGATVWIFGSRARGDHQKFSDVDIMVEASVDLGPILSQIREHFETSNFPFRLDIVEKKNFASSYLSSYEKDRIRLAAC
jgi:predicted nucleotidyltransferase